MIKSRRSFGRARGQPIVTPWRAAYQRVWRERPHDLSPRARARLAMIDWHLVHGANVSRTVLHV